MLALQLKSAVTAIAGGTPAVWNHHLLELRTPFHIHSMESGEIIPTSLKPEL